MVEHISEKLLFSKVENYHVHHALAGYFNMFIYRPWTTFMKTKIILEGKCGLFEKWTKKSQTKKASDATNLIRREPPATRRTLNQTIDTRQDRRNQKLVSKVNKIGQRVGNITSTLKNKRKREAKTAAKAAAKAVATDAAEAETQDAVEDVVELLSNDEESSGDEETESSNDDEEVETEEAEEPASKKRRLKEIPCKFFLAGRCNRGNNCRFSHDVEVPPPSPNGKRGRRIPKTSPTLKNQKHLEKQGEDVSESKNGKGKSNRNRRSKQSGPGSVKK